MTKLGKAEGERGLVEGDDRPLATARVVYALLGTGGTR